MVRESGQAGMGGGAVHGGVLPVAPLPVLVWSVICVVLVLVQLAT